MTTHKTNHLMVYIKMNIRKNRTYIKVRIDYVDNTVNTEPGIAIYTYSRVLYHYVVNTVDTQPDDLYKTYHG